MVLLRCTSTPFRLNWDIHFAIYHRVATAGLVAVLQIWLKIQQPPQSIYSSTKTEKQTSRIQLVLCLVAPYAVFLVFSIWSGLIGKQNFQLSYNTNGLYCSLGLAGLSRYGIPAYCTGIMIALLCFEVAIFVKYYNIRGQASRAFTLLKREIPFTLILRMALFSLASVLVFSTGVLFMSNQLVPWPYMVQAALPLLAVSIFGTQKDLLKAWEFRRHLKQPPASLQIPDIVIPGAHVASASGSRTRFESAPPSAVERVVKVFEVEP